MKVRVLPECRGFYGGKMRYGADDDRPEGDVFDIKARTCRNRVDSQGKPVVLSEDEQFSAKWMEKVKPGPKAKAAE